MEGVLSTAGASKASASKASAKQRECRQQHIGPGCRSWVLCKRVWRPSQVAKMLAQRSNLTSFLSSPSQVMITRVMIHPGHDHPGHDHPGHDHPGHDHPGHDPPPPGHGLQGHDHLGHLGRLGQVAPASKKVVGGSTASQLSLICNATAAISCHVCHMPAGGFQRGVDGGGSHWNGQPAPVGFPARWGKPCVQGSRGASACSEQVVLLGWA